MGTLSSNTSTSRPMLIRNTKDEGQRDGDVEDLKVATEEGGDLRSERGDVYIWVKEIWAKEYI